MQRHLHNRLRFQEYAFALLWLLIVGFGIARLWIYSSTPGSSESSPSQWPAASRIPRVPDRPTLVMSVHPRCPCSRASLCELKKILTRCRFPVTTIVLFYRPRQASADWARTDLYRQAAAIPGVTTLMDEEGAEARRFHALTSGQTMLYDREGQRQFSGGITSARGHEGDNSGEAALEALLNHRAAAQTQTPVFGCSLTGSPAP